MEYTIIDLETFNKIKLYNVDDDFYNSNGKIIKKDNNCFLLGDDFLIPKENVSNHILLTSNGKNYLITKIIKNNKNYDSIFVLDSKKAFEVYCYFKEKQKGIIKDASDIIDKYNEKLLNKWCCKFIVLFKNIDNLSLTYDIKDKYEDFREYVLCQILLCCTNNLYDEKKIIVNSNFAKIFAKKVESLNRIIEPDMLTYLITKKYCNNVCLLSKFEGYNLNYEKIIYLFTKSVINKSKNYDCIKLTLKNKK